jgi:integrase
MPYKRNLDFFIHAPNKHGRKTFAILKRENGTSKSLKIPELDAINRKFLDKTIDHNTAVELVQELKDKLYERHKVEKYVHNENLDLLKDHWEKRYEHKDIKDKDSAYSRLRRAVEAIEDLSLLTATTHELQAKISKHPAQRRIAAALNQMLKHIGRDVRIPLNRKPRTKPRHLTPDELEKVLLHVKSKNKDLTSLLCRAAIGSGLRLGELFALNVSNLREDGDIIYVAEQMGYDGTFDETKTRSDRLVPVLPRYKDFVKQWIARVSRQDKIDMRKWDFAKILKKACMEVFADQPEKHCVFHDLRHSYAIELLRLGYGISVIARCLGNSAQVCQEYYAGFSMTSDDIMGIVSKLKTQTSV